MTIFSLHLQQANNRPLNYHVAENIFPLTHGQTLRPYAVVVTGPFGPIALREQVVYNSAMSASPLRLLLVDDHALLRTGLRQVLESALPGVRIVEAGSMAEAMALDGEPPDLVLLDIDMPGLSGIEGLPLLHRKWPATPIIILTSHVEADARATGLARGAAAFLPKSESVDRMVVVIQAVLRGDPAEDKVAAIGNHPAPPLTPRQCEVLDQVCRGFSNKVIGRHLNLSENTVRRHVQDLLAALGVASRTEAAAAARERGLVR